MLGRFAQSRPTLVRLAVRVAWFSALWIILVEGELHHPTIAMLSIVGAAAMGVRTGVGRGWRISVRGLLRFIPYFIRVSMAGGFDVAQRAFRSQRALDPGMIDHRLRIAPDRPAHAFFANVTSLIPGTLCAGIDGMVVKVHVIDRGQDPAKRLTELEERVAALFGEPLESGGDR